MIHPHTVNGKLRWFSENGYGFIHLLEQTGPKSVSIIGEWDTFKLNLYLYGYQQ